MENFKNKIELFVLIMLLAGASIPTQAQNWNSTSSLFTTRYYHTATFLSSGKVLITGGADGSVPLSSCEIYNPADSTWSITGSLSTARYSHTSTLLPSGKVLITGGVGGSGYSNSCEIYDPADGTWSNAGSLVTARGYHTSTLLSSGKVLVAGGYSGSGHLSNCEIYNPANSTWSITGSLSTARYLHTATLLPSGKVLVTGGYGSSGNLSSCEIYDPADSAWSITSSLSVARNGHTSTLLPNGKVLIACGQSGSGYLSSCEIYNPAQGIWSKVGSLVAARGYHTSVPLSNGKVLIAGGYNNGGGYLSNCEIYNPADSTWSITGSLSTARYLHTATLLPSGKVLVTGGHDGVPLSSCELYDPCIDPTVPTLSANSSTILCNQIATLSIAGGNINDATRWQWYSGNCGDAFVGSGTSINVSPSITTTYYARGEGGCISPGNCGSIIITVTPGNSPTVPTLSTSSSTICDNQSATLSIASGTLNDATHWQWYSGSCGGVPVGSDVSINVSPASSKTYYARGEGGCVIPGSCASITIDVINSVWSSIGSMTTARAYHTATILANGKVLVTGGYNSNGFMSSCEIYDPITDTWSSTGSLATARIYHTATLLSNGQVLVVGGHNSSGDFNSCEIYDPTTGTWNSTGSLGVARLYHSATLLSNGKVLVSGGYNSNGDFSSCEIYDPASGTWSSTGSLANTRSVHTATVLSNGKVLVAGGNRNGSGYLSSCEIYDQATGAWSSTGSLVIAHYFHTATLLSNGKVLIAGGNYGSGPSSICEIYDPVTGVWINTSSLATARLYHKAALLSNGKVLVSGGNGSSGNLNSCEIYDPSIGTWSSANALATDLLFQTSTLMANGKVLLAGGWNGGIGYVNNCEIYGCCTEPTVPTLNTSSSTNCGTQSTTLNIANGILNDATDWQWYRGSCGGTPIGSGTSINVSPSVTTTYYARGEGGCVSPGSCGSITITVNQINSPTVPTLNTSSSTNCGIQSTTLSIASGALNNAIDWQWYSGSCEGISGGNGASINVSPSVTTTYYARGEGGCITLGSCDSITITVNQPPGTPTLSATSSTICNGLSVNLSIVSGILNSGTNWYWYSESCEGTPIGSGTSVSVSPTVTTTYFARGEGVCAGSCDSITINVTPIVSPTVPTLSTSSSINCGIQSTTLSIASGALNNAIDWQWYSGNCGGAFVGSGTSVNVSPSITTTYYTRGEGGCITLGSCGSIIIAVTGAGTPTGPNVRNNNQTISTQTQMNAFFNTATGQKWTKIKGNLTLDGSNPTDPITNFCNLGSLTEITGSLLITNFNMAVNPVHLADLSALAIVGCDLTIVSNPQSQSIELIGLASVGCDLSVTDNVNATEINMPLLQTIDGKALVIKNNPAVESISLSANASSFSFTGNRSSIDVSDNGGLTSNPLTINMKKITVLEGPFVFDNNDNPGVSNFDDIFSGLTNISSKKSGDLTVTNNNYLAKCCIVANAVVAGTRTISGNIGYCVDAAAVLADCGALKRTTLIEETPIVGFKGMSLNLYPSPNNGKFVIDISASEKGALRLTVMDLLGRVVFSQQQDVSNSASIPVNIEFADEGQYIVKAEMNGQLLVRKFMLINSPYISDKN